MGRRARGLGAREDREGREGREREGGEREREREREKERKMGLMGYLLISKGGYGGLA